MTTKSILQLHLFTIFTLLAHVKAEDALVVGDSTITRDRVNMALHVPATADKPHGPMGVLVFFGGVGDSIDYYQKAFTEMADKLDLIVIIPQMPWFDKRGEVDTPGVIKVLDDVVTQIETQFHTDPNLRLVGGASAGGAPAHDLTKKWGAKVPFQLLHSTVDSAWVKGPRLLHLVGRNETGWLGTDAHSGQGFDINNKDLYAVPDEDHQVHFRHMQPWLETELSAWRIINMSSKRGRGEDEAALNYLKKSYDLLSETLQGDDAFLQYQNKRRKELCTKLKALNPEPKLE